MTSPQLGMRSGVALLACALVACARGGAPESGSAQSVAVLSDTGTGMDSQLTPEERAEGWRSLFDGRTLNGWRVYHSQAQPRRWFVRDGLLTKTTATDDIISVEQFGDFELAFDWRLSRGGNAGVFYRATEEYEKVYWSATEYQLLDDANAGDGQDRLTAAGAAYGLYPAVAGAVKPAGEWNSTRIVVQGTRAEHWLNGTRLLEYDYASPDWAARVKASKFGEWPNYGRARRGHIAIQGDHAGELSLRSIRIRER